MLLLNSVKSVNLRELGSTAFAAKVFEALPGIISVFSLTCTLAMQMRCGSASAVLDASGLWVILGLLCSSLFCFVSSIFVTLQPIAGALSIHFSQVWSASCSAPACSSRKAWEVQSAALSPAALSPAALGKRLDTVILRLLQAPRIQWTQSWSTWRSIRWARQLPAGFGTGRRCWRNNDNGRIVLSFDIFWSSSVLVVPAEVHPANQRWNGLGANAISIHSAHSVVAPRLAPKGSKRIIGWDERDKRFRLIGGVAPGSRNRPNIFTSKTKAGGVTIQLQRSITQYKRHRVEKTSRQGKTNRKRTRNVCGDCSSQKEVRAGVRLNQDVTSSRKQCAVV